MSCQFAVPPFPAGRNSVSKGPGWRAIARRMFFMVVALVLAQVLAQAVTPDAVDPSYVPQLPDRFARPIVKALPDGSLLVAQIEVGLRRLTPAGAVDPGFATDFPGENVIAQKAAVLLDGRIILLAYFYPDPNTLITRVVRLLPDGRRDWSFGGTTGVLIEPALGEGNPWFSELHALPDGQVVIAGRFGTVSGQPKRNIVRLHSDGSIDGNFHSITDAAHGILAAAVQVDGKVLVSGAYYQPSLSTRRLLRLNADGSLDQTFNPGAGPNAEPLGILLQADGRIVIGGHFSYVAGWLRTGVARLLPDGAVDPSFDPGAGLGDRFYGGLSSDPAYMQPNGKILLLGQFQKYDGYLRRFLVRLNQDGTLDESFGPGFAGDRAAGALDVLPDGRIAIAGEFTQISGLPRPGLAILLGGESPDAAPAISVPATQSVPAHYPVTLAATVSASPPPTLQWHKAGVPIAGATGRRLTLRHVISADAGSYQLRAHNSMGSATGEITLVVGPLLRVPGALDATFDPSFAEPTYGASAVQSNGRALMVSAIPATGSTPDSWLMRFNVDGSIDPTFNPGPNPSVSRGRVLSVDGQDRIWVGGSPQPAIPSGLIRLLPDGTRDQSFTPAASVRLRSPSGSIRSLEISEGSVDVHGYFEGSTAEHTTRLFRLLDNGSLAPGFDADRVCLHGSEGAPMLRMPDDSLWVPGQFYPDPECRGPTTASLVRFTSSGRVDTNFFQGDKPSYPPASIARQADGKVLIGGQFSRIGRHAQPTLARLRPDGSWDRSFTPAIDTSWPRDEDDDDDDDDWDDDRTTVYSSVTDIAVDVDGGIYIAGSFEEVDGISRPGLARLLTDGSVDLTFAPPRFSIQPAPDIVPQIRQVHLLPDGDLIVSGWFTHYNGAQRLGLARLFGTGLGEPVAGLEVTLEAALRLALAKPAGPLTTRDLARLTTLDLTGHTITSLAGLGAAKNLRALILDGNPLTSLATLSDLTALRTLSLVGITDVELRPLLSLPSLRVLCLEASLATGANVQTVELLRGRGTRVVTFSTAAALPDRFHIRRIIRAVHIGTRDASYAPTIEWGTKLRWPSEAGRRYRIERSEDLRAWTDADFGDIVAEGSSAELTLPEAPSPTTFYRLRSDP